MRKIKTYLAFLTLVCLLFSSCSKEEATALDDDPANKGTLIFGALLNDLMNDKAALKQVVNGGLPACSDEDPSFVEIVLSFEGEPVVGTLGNPLRIDVNPNALDYDDDGEAEYFTNESTSLELSPGTYTLEYFTVLNADGDVIWVAPINDDGNGFAAFVDSPLPMDIALGAGVKKYVSVEVLCFDDREVNEYGYQFFDIDGIEVFEFCFFANYCSPQDLHFPAALSIDIWVGDNGSGMPFYSNVTNDVRFNDDGEPFASVLCFALPDLDEFDDDEEYIYYEITLLDWEAAYGDVDATLISGTLSRNDITANFDGPDHVDYEHFRFGCVDDDSEDDDDGPGGDDDDDGDNDDDDQGDDDSGEYSGCETTYMKGDTEFDELDFKSNNWGWAEFWDSGDKKETFELWAAAGQNNTSKGYHVGNVTVEVDGDDVEFSVDMFDGYELEKAQIYLEGDKPKKHSPGQYTYHREGLNYDLDVEDMNDDGSFWIIFHGEVCGEKE